MTKVCRVSFLTTICFLALLIFVSHGNALFDSNVDKAKEFMQAGMYPQATTLLEKEISDNPTNAEAHFQLGICYINQNNYSSADDRFASAVRLKSDYGYKIGKEYKKTADFAVNKSRLSDAKTLYDKVIEYDPSLKKGIAQKLFRDGKQNDDDQLLSLVVSLDRSFSNDVADYYYSLSQRSQGEDSLQVLSKALSYSDKYRKEFHDQKLIIGKSYLNEATRLSKIPGKEKEAEEYKKRAIKYLGKDAVEEAIPDHKYYKPGEYTFSLKAGEQTPYWIGFAQKGRYSLSSSDDKFKLVYSDGEVAPAWTPGSWPNKSNVKFKIIAVTDQPLINMTVK